MMIPEHRMAELLTQVKEASIQNCPYHNIRQWPSLYTDHICERGDFPLDTVCELERHTDEVWFIAFSNDGTRLATASKDSQVIIYETETFQILHILSSGHKGAVGFLAWSPDDTKLITCSQITYPPPTEARQPKEHTAQIWDTETGSCLRTIKVHNEPVTTAVWSPDGQSFVTGSLDHRHPLVVWSVNTISDKDYLHIFGLPNPTSVANSQTKFSTNQDFRVQSCSIATLSPSSASLEAFPNDQSSSDLANRPVRLAAVCTNKSIHIFDYHTRQKLNLIQIGYEITSLTYSRDGLELLANLSNGELWTVDGESGTVNMKFFGRGQEEFVIRSCWGGATEGVVVSGGEGEYSHCSFS